MRRVHLKASWTATTLPDKRALIICNTVHAGAPYQYRADFDQWQPWRRSRDSGYRLPPGIVSDGTIHLNDGVAAQAHHRLQPGGTAGTVDLTGQDLTGILTLNAQGNPNALFIFKTGSSLIAASNASVVVIGGGSNCNVFWQVGSSAPHRHQLCGQYPGALQHYLDHRRYRVRQGFGTQWCRDPGYQPEPGGSEIAGSK